MKKITLKLIFSVVTITLLTNCEGKKKPITKETEEVQQFDSVNSKKNKIEDTIKPADKLTFESYTFAENLKNDSFFESDHVDKIIELKNVGIVSYFVSGEEVSIIGIFYDKEKNRAIPRYENNPPGRSFVPDFFDKREIKYDEKYKSTYSATLRISLKNHKDVKKLKMYMADQPVLNYEYKVDGTLDEYRSGFVDLINVKGTFKGVNADSGYPNKNYEIESAEIK